MIAAVRARDVIREWTLAGVVRVTVLLVAQSSQAHLVIHTGIWYVGFRVALSLVSDVKTDCFTCNGVELMLHNSAMMSQQ